LPFVSILTKTALAQWAVKVDLLIGAGNSANGLVVCIRLKYVLETGETLYGEVNLAACKGWKQQLGEARRLN
jgi:hypothetical protein